MKKQVQNTIHALLKDRYLGGLLTVFLVLCLITIIYLAFMIHASELQVVVHYTSFGATNFYRDKWYYLLFFIAFVVILAVAHFVICLKLLEKRGREFALAFAWLSIIVVFIAASLFYQVLKIASLS